MENARVKAVCVYFLLYSLLNMNTHHHALSYSLSLLLFAGSSSISHASNIVTQWNDVALEAIRTTLPGPPIVARALAIAHTCMYDAWAAYDAQALGSQLGSNLRRPIAERTDSNKNQAISYAAYYCLTDLFPSQTSKFVALMTSLGYAANTPNADNTSPQAVALAAASAVLNFRHADGANQLGDLHAGAYSDYTGYKPINTPEAIIDPNHWQPLKVGEQTQNFITPHWGLVKPFALSSGAELRNIAPAPALFASEPLRYQAQAQEVLDYAANLSDEKKVIAEYWADGPHSELPPGHWNLFAQYVSTRDQHTLDQDVKLFFALNNAMLDAGIVTWDAKRAFDYVRPITAIHFLFAGQRVKSWQGDIDGAQWKPYQAANVVTPPFAEYWSGHSTYSASGAEILKAFTHSDHFGYRVSIPAGSSKVEPGSVPAKDTALYWATFSDAADEAGISRRYGGIHFSDGDLAGRKAGRVIAQQVWEKSLSLFNDASLTDSYDEVSHELTLNDVLVQTQHYRVKLKYLDNARFSILSATPIKTGDIGLASTFNLSTGMLNVAHVRIAGKKYTLSLALQADGSVLLLNRVKE